MVKKHFALAQVALSIDAIDEVQVSSTRMVFAHAPDERFVEQFPEDAIEQLNRMIEGKEWRCSYTGGELETTAEKHDWSLGAHHNPIIPSHKQPAGYELQKSIVRR